MARGGWIPRALRQGAVHRRLKQAREPTWDLPEMTRLYKFGGGALVASGILFAVLAFLDFRTGRPPSNGADILGGR
jgi:hypothetical protein